MILRPEQINLLRLGLPVIPANGGSDSESQANNTSTTTNTNHVTSSDNRIVASDAAIGFNGSGNLVDRSSSSTTVFTDTSNRSTNFNDSSDRSTSIVNTTTDFGSIQAALGGMGTVSKQAIDMADHSITGAISSLKSTGDNGLAMVMAAFNNAGKQAAAAEAMSKSVMDFSSAAISKTGDAYAAAANPNNETTKTIMLGLTAAVAAVGVAIAMRD